MRQFTKKKRSLLEIKDGFKKNIITKNGLSPNKDNFGILTIDLLDFLLNSDSLSF